MARDRSYIEQRKKDLKAKSSAAGDGSGKIAKEFPFGDIDDSKEESVGKTDMPEEELPESIKSPPKKKGSGGVSVFGADMDILVKKKLEARQYLAKGNRNPTDSIQTQYSSGGGAETFLLDGSAGLGVNLQFDGQADFSSRTPIVRMWTCLELQTLSEERSWHKTQDKNRKRKPEKYQYTVRGSRVIESTLNHHDRMVYTVGNHNLNILTGQPNQPRTGTKLGQTGETVLPNPGKSVGGLTGNEYQNNEFLSPPAGITAVTSETEGAMGLIKKTNVSFTVNNFHDFENIYQRYFLKPGAMIFIDFGWSSSGPLYDPKLLAYDEFKQGKELDEILYGDGGIITNASGDLDIVQGFVTEFNSKLTTDGIYECSLEIVSKNSSLLEASFLGGAQSQKKQLLATIDAAVLNFAAKHFGTNLLGNNKIYDYTQAQSSNEILYTFVSEVLQSSAVTGRNPNVKIPAKKEVLLTGVYWQTHYANATDDDGEESLEETPAGTENIYIMWGLFEDIIMNKQFGFGRDENDVLYGNDVSMRFDSSNSYVTYETKLELSTFVKKSEPFTFRYPETWDKTYNTYRNKVNINRLDGKGKYKKGGPDGKIKKWTDLDKSMRRIPLREVFVNLSVIKDAIDKKSNVKEIIKSILSELKEASEDIWSLEIGGARKDGSQVAIIDRNFVQVERDDDGKGGYLNNLFCFKPHSPESIVKDFNLEFAMPSGDMGSMIAIGSGGAGSSIFAMDKRVDQNLAMNIFNELGQDLKVEYLPSMGTYPMEKYQKKISEGFIVDSLYNNEDKIFAGDAETSNEILSNFGNIRGKSHYANKTVARVGVEAWNDMFETTDNSDDDETAGNDTKEELQSTESDFLNDNDQLAPTIQKYYKLLAKSSFFFLNTSTLLPVSISLKIDGISSLNVGNLFRVDYLPKMYRDSVYFQITGLKQDISPDGWSTEIEAIMRVSPMAKQKSNIFAESAGIFLSKKALTDGLEVNITNKAVMQSKGKKTELFPFWSRGKVLGRGDSEYNLGYTSYLFSFEACSDYLVTNGEFKSNHNASADNEISKGARAGNIHWGYIYGKDAPWVNAEWKHNVDFQCNRFKDFVITGLQDDKVSGNHGGMGWDFYYNMWACNIKTSGKYIMQVSKTNVAVIYPYPENASGGTDKDDFKQLRRHVDGIFHMYSGLYYKNKNYKPSDWIWQRLKASQNHMDGKKTGFYENGRKPRWLNNTDHYIKSVAGEESQRFSTD
jgi:hypothetical protein